MITGLQALLDKEGLTEDSIKLHNYNSNNKIIKIIDEIKSELADTTDDMGELSMIYKFAERIKEEIEWGNCMIKVIGQKNCSRCDMVKNILNQHNVKYVYFLIEDLNEDEKIEYITMARETGNLQMPLIIKNEQLINLKEVM